MGHIGKWWTILDQLGQFWTCFDLCLSVKQRVLKDPDPDTVRRLPCKQTSKPPRPDSVPVWRRLVPFPVVPGSASESLAPTLPVAQGPALPTVPSGKLSFFDSRTSPSSPSFLSKWGVGRIPPPDFVQNLCPGSSSRPSNFLSACHPSPKLRRARPSMVILFREYMILKLYPNIEQIHATSVRATHLVLRGRILFDVSNLVVSV